MKVFFDMVGCRVNQAELETLAADFRTRGCPSVDRPEEADLVVVNTCAVTGEAARDSRQKARQAHSRNPQARLALTGCWATLEPASAQALAGAGWVVPNTRKDELVGILLGDEEPPPVGSLRLRLEGSRRKTRAFIKAQDGCDNTCSFCVTRIARGEVRSRPAEMVIREIHGAEAAGALEAVIAGVHLAAWGKDLGAGFDLVTLLHAVLARTSIPRIRLSSVEPRNLRPSFFELFADPRLCPHLHLPLQSGSAAVLQRMRRAASADRFLDVALQASAAIPDLAVTSDLIVGFPGESEADFMDSLDLIRQANLARVHVFPFSARSGTDAARLADRVPSSEIRRRSAMARACAAESERRFMDRFIGRDMDVLWEASRRAGIGQGWTGNYLRVRGRAPAGWENSITRIRLGSIEGDSFQPDGSAES